MSDGKGKTKTDTRPDDVPSAAASDKLPSQRGRGAVAGASGDAEVAEFVRRMKEMAPRTATGSGRLVFAMDATMSRQPTWDMALELQADMFRAVKAVGGLDVQLVFFRGAGECRASKWVSDPEALAALMTRVALRRRLYADPQGAEPCARRGGQEAGQRPGLRRRLHGGGHRRSVRARRRAGPAGRAGVPVPGGTAMPAPRRPSARSPGSPRAPTAASTRARPGSCGTCCRRSPSTRRAGARRSRR